MEKNNQISIIILTLFVIPSTIFATIHNEANDNNEKKLINEQYLKDSCNYLGFFEYTDAFQSPNFDDCLKMVNEYKTIITPFCIKLVSKEIESWKMELPRVKEIFKSFKDSIWNFDSFISLLSEVTDKYTSKLGRLNTVENIMKYKSWDKWKQFCDDRIIYKFDTYKSMPDIIKMDDTYFDLLQDYINWTDNKLTSSEQPYNDKSEYDTEIMKDVGCPYSYVKLLIIFGSKRELTRKLDRTTTYNELYKIYDVLCTDSFHNNWKLKLLNEVLDSEDMIRETEIIEFINIIKYGYLTYELFDARTKEDSFKLITLKNIMKLCFNDEICMAYVSKGLRDLDLYAGIDCKKLGYIMERLKYRNVIYNMKDLFHFFTLIHFLKPTDNIEIYEYLFIIFVRNFNDSYDNEKAVIENLKSITIKPKFERIWDMNKLKEFLNYGVNNELNIKQLEKLLRDNKTDEFFDKPENSIIL
ncbi:uncharacterized protein LOC142333750 [Lycorma delicatula]|uniref:uncharacterized protein LOC142333750 n=1 Tax=Lycorma delicatula TaxID=130591 RepID=UPI003F519232